MLGIFRATVGAMLPGVPRPVVWFRKVVSSDCCVGFVARCWATWPHRRVRRHSESQPTLRLRGDTSASFPISERGAARFAPQHGCGRTCYRPSKASPQKRNGRSSAQRQEGLQPRGTTVSIGGAMWSAVVIRYGLTDSAARIRRRRRSTSRKAMASRSLNADAGGSKTADGGVRSFLNGHLLVSGALS